MEEEKRPKGLDEQADWVMSFVDDSAESRREFEDIWDETELNYMVRPLGEQHSSTQYPFSTSGSGWESQLKDPETHQEVVTIASKIVLALFGSEGFVKARRVGFEDILKAKTVSGLLEFVEALPTHFITRVEWIFNTGVYGVGILEASWDYMTEPRSMRAVEVDDFGQEVSSFQILDVPVRDDVRYRVLPIRDAYPDLSKTNTHDMIGFAKRFRITTDEALLRAERGQYNKEATKRAVERRAPTDDIREDSTHDDTMGIDTMEMHPSFGQLVGYEYHGMIPFKSRDGIQKRVITVLNGETVRSKPWPRRIPFFECKILPRMNSFYGIAPAEVIRFDQDFADTLKMMLADAVVMAVHPPHIVDRNQDVDMAKVRRWDPRVPIMANDVNAVSQVPYNPPVAPAFAMYSGVKDQMREATGALGAVQGLGLGSKRFSATESAATFQQALDKPELFAQIVEREYLPPIGKYTLELYQTFLQDTEDLRRRVGESDTTAVLADILADYDIRFVGSRVEGNKAQELDSFREIGALGANPMIAPLIPWIPLLQKHFEGLGAYELAAMVGNPQMMELYMALHQIGGPNQQAGNGNGTQPSTPPTGLMPAQVSGGLQ